MPFTSAGGAGSAYLAISPTAAAADINEPITGSVLVLVGSLQAPPNATVTVSSFTVQGVDGQLLTPSPRPVGLTNPTTGKLAGMLVLQASGMFTFTPAADYIGPAPVVSFTATSSDGQSVISALTIDVVAPGTCCMAMHGIGEVAVRHATLWALGPEAWAVMYVHTDWLAAEDRCCSAL